MMSVCLAEASSVGPLSQEVFARAYWHGSLLTSGRCAGCVLVAVTIHSSVTASALMYHQHLLVCGRGFLHVPT